MLQLPPKRGGDGASQRERGGGLSFFRPRTYRKGYYFYSPQSSTVIKSKMAATTILRTTKKVSPTENTPALQAKNSFSVHSICRPAAIADVPYFLHRRCPHGTFVTQAVRTCACCVPHIEKQVCVEEDWNEFFLRSRSSDRSSKESVNKYGISCVWIQTTNFVRRKMETSGS